MDKETRDEALDRALGIAHGAAPAGEYAMLIACALVASSEREAAYQTRIAELQGAVERTAASGVDNAKRYAADLDRERLAGAAAVARIREAIAAGATDAEQAQATRYALDLLDRKTMPVFTDWSTPLARAYLALSESHAEVRATLRDIGTKALARHGEDRP